MTNVLDEWSDDLSGRTTPRLRAAIEALLSGRDPREIVGIGVCTDADAAAIVVAANTRSHYEARVASMPRYPRFLRWSTGEWDLQGIRLPGGDGLGPFDDEVERLLGAADRGELEGVTTGDVRLASWRALSASLAALRREGLFARWPDAIVMLDAVDAGVSDDRQRGWARALNDPADAAAFEEWLADPSS